MLLLCPLPPATRGVIRALVETQQVAHAIDAVLHATCVPAHCLHRHPWLRALTLLPPVARSSAGERPGLGAFNKIIGGMHDMVDANRIDPHAVRLLTGCKRSHSCCSHACN